MFRLFVGLSEKPTDESEDPTRRARILPELEVEKKNLPLKIPFPFVRTVLTVAQPRDVFFWIFTRPALPHGVRPQT
jgi:hypothetical protein